MPRVKKDNDPDWKEDKTKKQSKSKTKTSVPSSKPTVTVHDHTCTSASGTTVPRLRRGETAKDSVLFSKDCIFCKSLKAIKVKQVKEYPTPFQSDSYKTVQNKAIELGDEALLLRIRDVNLFAVEAHFHPHCRAVYNAKKPKVSEESDNPKDPYKQALDAVVSKINKGVLEKDGIVTLQQLTEIYNDTHGCPGEVRSGNVRRAIESHEISSHIDLAASSFQPTLIYKKNTEKISTLVRSAFDLGQKDMAKDVAIQIHNRIDAAFREKEPLPWPPRAKDLQRPEDEIPHEVLSHVMNMIDPKGSNNEKMRKLGLSIAQDLCRAATNCEWKMEKHILICMTIRHLFRDKTFMTLL